MKKRHQDVVPEPEPVAQVKEEECQALPEVPENQILKQSPETFIEQ